MDRLVKVQSYLGVAEAELARIRLAMDGISARLSNEKMVIWFWHYSNVTGGVKLFVKESDLPQAAMILSTRPAPSEEQPPGWNCSRCQADVDGQWSSCWSCGTSHQGEEDPDFHTWYRDTTDGVLSTKSSTDVIAAVITAFYFAIFLCTKTSPFVIFAWLITLTLWVVISRIFAKDQSSMMNAADLDSDIQQFSETDYIPARDEFNTADGIAYNFWKSVIFGLGDSLLFYPFAFWLWYKTNQHASSLSDKGLHYYFYALLILIIGISLNGLFFMLMGFLF